jgi:hypothetical protein
LKKHLELEIKKLGLACSSVVEHLPSMHKALRPIPCTGKKQKEFKNKNEKTETGRKEKS